MLHDKFGRTQPSMTGETGHILNMSEASSEASAFRCLHRSDAELLAVNSSAPETRTLELDCSSYERRIQEAWMTRFICARKET